jgi:hypothetical protein
MKNNHVILDSFNDPQILGAYNSSAISIIMIVSVKIGLLDFFYLWISNLNPNPYT